MISLKSLLSPWLPFEWRANQTTYTYDFVSPTEGLQGISDDFTLTLSMPANVAVNFTLSDYGAGGTFTPSSVVIPGGEQIGTFKYTPPRAGTYLIRVTNNANIPEHPPQVYTSYVEDAKQRLQPGISFVVFTEPLYLEGPRAGLPDVRYLRSFAIQEYPRTLKEGDTFTLYGADALRVEHNITEGSYWFLKIVA